MNLFRLISRQNANPLCHWKPLSENIVSWYNTKCTNKFYFVLVCINLEILISFIFFNIKCTGKIIISIFSIQYKTNGIIKPSIKFYRHLQLFFVKQYVLYGQVSLCLFLSVRDGNYFSLYSRKTLLLQSIHPSHLEIKLKYWYRNSKIGFLRGSKTIYLSCSSVLNCLNLGRVRNLRNKYKQNKNRI